jgi:hypothetical protein
MSNATDKANSSTLAKLRAAVADGDPLAKVADLIGDLESRIARLEKSAIDAEKTRPIPMRRKVA